MSKKKPSKANGEVVNRAEAEFVVITAPDDVFEKGPHPILLDTGACVWVPGTKEVLTNPDVVQVKDGGKSFDAQGNTIVSVPAEWCTFISEEQAYVMAEALDCNKDEVQV